MKRFAALTAAFLSLVLLCGCAFIESMLNDGPSVTPGSVIYPDIDDGEGFGDPGEAVEFTLPDLEGTEISLSDYAGQAVVLNFWASWCEPCAEELPGFQVLHDEFSQSGEAAVLMVNLTDGRMETEEEARSFISEQGYTFRVLIDEGEKVGDAYNIYALPTTIVIGADGEIYKRYDGITDPEDVRAWVSEANQ